MDLETGTKIGLQFVSANEINIFYLLLAAMMQSGIC
jgi:hypothetical protein